jgi:molybdopterin-synthase adenylyltransferase
MLGAMAGWTATFAAMQAVRVLLAHGGLNQMGDPQWGRCTCSTVSSPVCGR